MAVLAMDPIAQVNSALAATTSMSGWASSLSNGIFTMVGNMFNEVFKLVSTSFFFQIIGFIIIIGVFLKGFFEFIWEILRFIFYKFPGWFLDLGVLFSLEFYKPKKEDSKKQVGFIPYVVRYMYVIAVGVMNLPKCILWYALDTLGWILYLPFRFVFWTLDYLLSIGLTEKEHQFWDFLDGIDYFLHGPENNWFMYQYKDQSRPKPDPNSMNLGFHLIHFPNSVMEKCFSISPYQLKSCPIGGVIKAFNKLMNAATMRF
jgi:hypothetical protein